MFLWNMSLETGIAAIDLPRRQLIEAMADFFRILDDPTLNQKMVAEHTGTIYKFMKAAFTAEDQFLKAQTGEETEGHQTTHATQLAAYVDLCRKAVPKIRNLKQAQHICQEIYLVIDHGLYSHLKNEALDYKHLLRAAGHK